MRGRGALYVLVALFLTLWLCVGTVVFATRADGKLYRYERCIDFRDPVWQIHDGNGLYFEDYLIMSQRWHVAYEYTCTFSPS